MKMITLRWDGKDNAEWSDDGCARRVPLSEAAAAVAEHRCVVLVPGRDVLLAQADIPSRRRAEVERALPYALEEWLVEPPETQHYAWHRTDSGVAAAVVSRRQLDAWLEQLAKAGIEPQVLLPETLALPLEQGEWSLALAGNDAWLRTGALSGYACNRDVLPALFTSLWASCSEAQRPKRLRAWMADGELPGELPLLVVTEPSPESITAALGAPDEALNLLSGRYAPRRQLTSRFGPWRVAAVMAGIWLLSTFGLHIAEYYRLSHEASTLQTRIDTVFHASVPQEKRIVDAKVQMQQALEAMTTNESQRGDALTLLAQLAGVFTTQKGLKITELTYRNGHLGLRLTGADFNAFETFKKRLQKRGLQTALSSVSDRKGVSRGHLKVWQRGGA